MTDLERNEGVAPEVQQASRIRREVLIPIINSSLESSLINTDEEALAIAKPKGLNEVSTPYSLGGTSLPLERGYLLQRARLRTEQDTSEQP